MQTAAQSHLCVACDGVLFLMPLKSRAGSKNLLKESVLERFFKNAVKMAIQYCDFLRFSGAHVKTSR